jgi:hypothetical protein
MRSTGPVSPADADVEPPPAPGRELVVSLGAVVDVDELFFLALAQPPARSAAEMVVTTMSGRSCTGSVSHRRS